MDENYGQDPYWGDDEDFIWDDEDYSTFEPMRRDMNPVSGKHDLQRRSENGINRHRKNDE